MILHNFGSYTFQDLLLAAAHLRVHITALHDEVRYYKCTYHLGYRVFAARHVTIQQDEVPTGWPPVLCVDAFT